MKVYVALACYNDWEESYFSIGVGSTLEIANQIIAEHKAADKADKTRYSWREERYVYQVDEWEVR